MLFDAMVVFLFAPTVVGVSVCCILVLFTESSNPMLAHTDVCAKRLWRSSDVACLFLVMLPLRGSVAWIVKGSLIALDPMDSGMSSEYAFAWHDDCQEKSFPDKRLACLSTDCPGDQYHFQEEDSFCVAEYSFSSSVRILARS